MFEPEDLQSANITRRTCLILLVTTPLALLFVLGACGLSPSVGKAWRKPNWRDNPFDFRQPLQCFHFIATSTIASGLGAFGSVTRLGPEVLLLASSIVAIGCGLILGLYIYVYAGGSRWERQ